MTLRQHSDWDNRERSMYFPQFWKKSPENIIIDQPKSNFVLVTSTICFSHIPLPHSPVRSVYSDSERFQQTIVSLEQVRKKIPDSLIIVLENSPVPDRYVGELKKRSDFVVLFAHDRTAVRYRDSPNIGSGELYMIARTLEFLENIRYRRLFKLSGRYYPTNDFDYGKFPSDRFGFLKKDNFFSTRLYCVPKNLERMYGIQIQKSLKLARKGLSIESTVLKDVPEDKICYLPFLGIAGNISHNGEFIAE